MVAFTLKKNLPEAKLMCSGLVSVAETSGQPNTDYATWSLVTPLRQIYDNQRKVRQKGIHSVEFGEKKDTRKFNAGAMVCMKLGEVEQSPHTLRP